MAVAAETARSTHESFMRQALEVARRSMAAGGPPVGACLVHDGAVLAVAQNSVIQELDVTAHAEVQVMREACRSLRTLSLAGCDLYVTVEPCAMCLTASFYAGVRAVYFGAPVHALQAFTGRELAVDQAVLFADTVNVPTVTGGMLAPECLELLQEWGQRRRGIT